MATPKLDPIIGRMDKLAGSLLDKAETALGAAEADLQQGLDVFNSVAKWAAIKKGLMGGEQGGESLDELKRKLHTAESSTGSRTPRGPGIARGGGNQLAASHARFNYPTGAGGSALDAIRARVPRADAGDHGGAGKGAVGAGAGNGGAGGDVHPDDDGDERPNL